MVIDLQQYQTLSLSSGLCDQKFWSGRLWLGGTLGLGISQLKFFWYISLGMCLATNKKKPKHSLSFHSTILSMLTCIFMFVASQSQDGWISYLQAQAYVEGKSSCTQEAAAPDSGRQNFPRKSSRRPLIFSWLGHVMWLRLDHSFSVSAILTF